MTQAHQAEPTSEPGDQAPGSAPDPAPGAPVSLEGAVEAMLLTAVRPLTPARIAEALNAAGITCDAGAVKAALERLNEHYDGSQRAFRAEQVAGGVRLITRAAFGPVLLAAHGARESQRLSRAAVETLAIIAYRQPLTRARIEAIRGVACGEVLRTLLEHRLIDIAGRAEELGRPMLYGTTRRFLELFGLASIRDLPPVGDDKPEPRAVPPAPAAGAHGPADQSGGLTVEVRAATATETAHAAGTNL